jgi:hypothetical protein
MGSFGAPPGRCRARAYPQIGVLAPLTPRRLRGLFKPFSVSQSRPAGRDAL